MPAPWTPEPQCPTLSCSLHGCHSQIALVVVREGAGSQVRRQPGCLTAQVWQVLPAQRVQLEVLHSHRCQSEKWTQHGPQADMMMVRVRRLPSDELRAGPLSSSRCCQHSMGVKRWAALGMQATRAPIC